MTKNWLRVASAKTVFNRTKTHLPWVCFSFVVLLSMIINTFHPYLWGPDEPREAEIARTVYVSGNFVTPHLCGVPFVEKPPLYYNLVAVGYMLGGGADPGIARLVSSLLGCLMLACVFVIGKRLFGFRLAVTATAALIIMPQFYRHAHWILLDIGVGAFCCLALACFAIREFCHDDNSKGKWLVYLFYLSSAGAFLTKSIAGVFYIVVVCGAYILVRCRWSLLRWTLQPLPIACFLLPVSLWIWLVYLEGGIYFLHEHFINNYIGRFLHINMTLEGSPISMTDVGNRSPWYFYLKRSPEMFGFIIAFIPLILFDALARLRILPNSWMPRPTRASDNRLEKLLAILLYGNVSENRTTQDIRLFLCLWAFLPICLLSLSSIKEVTYILPSYAAIALLTAWWIEERTTIFSKKPVDGGDEIWYACVVFPIALAAMIFPRHSISTYLVLVVGWMLVAVFHIVKDALRKNFRRMSMILLAVILGAVIVGNTPEIMLTTRLSRRCYIELAADVWNIVGEKNLYIYGGNETLRGSMPFYGNRDTLAIFDRKTLKETMLSDQNSYVIMSESSYKRLAKERPEDCIFFRECRVVRLNQHHNLDQKYVLITTVR